MNLMVLLLLLWFLLRIYSKEMAKENLSYCSFPSVFFVVVVIVVVGLFPGYTAKGNENRIVFVLAFPCLLHLEQ